MSKEIGKGGEGEVWQTNYSGYAAKVQKCFLRCFNDGHQNPNLRPTATDWVKALKTAANELTVCGKIDTHYYSPIYGKCYWCDRANNIGVDIFPAIVRPKP